MPSFWYPPDELGRDYARLREFASALEFEDFTFSAFIWDGALVLECKWREYTSRQIVGPQAFQNEALLMLTAKSAVHNIVSKALEENMRAAMARLGER